VGSVKTNVGHLESVAGLAGVILPDMHLNSGPSVWTHTSRCSRKHPGLQLRTVGQGLQEVSALQLENATGSDCHKCLGPGFASQHADVADQRAGINHLIGL
jgi:hypothetical protein